MAGLLPGVQAAPCSSPRFLQEALTFAGSVLGVVSRGAVGQAAIPQQQVPPVLALEAHAAAVPQVGHAPLAQGVAVWREQGTLSTEGQRRAWLRTAGGHQGWNLESKSPYPKLPHPFLLPPPHLVLFLSTTAFSLSL